MSRFVVVVSVSFACAAALRPAPSIAVANADVLALITDCLTVTRRADRLVVLAEHCTQIVP